MRLTKEKAREAADRKAEEVFYKLSLRSDFQRDVIECREKVGIPLDGFKDAEERKKWFGKIGKRYKPFMAFCGEMIDKHKLHWLAINLLEEYLLTNNQFSMWPSHGSQFFAEIVSDKTEREYRKIKKPYVKVLIFDHASQANVFDYLTENWKEIKEALGKQSGDNAQRIRFANNKERDELVMKFSGMSRSELGLKKGRYKELEIAKRMRDFGYKMSGETVRDVVARRQKLKKEVHKGGT